MTVFPLKSFAIFGIAQLEYTWIATAWEKERQFNGMLILYYNLIQKKLGD